MAGTPYDHRLTRKIRRLFFDRCAVNIVISNLILAGAVVALGFAVLSWTYSRSSVYNNEYANVMEANLDRIKEKLVFEYIFYNASDPPQLTVYLINCGEINDVSIANVYLSNSSWFESFPDVELWLLDGTSTESLDIREEGYFQIRPSVSLVADTSYSIRIVTGRGRCFDATFLA